MSNSTEILHEDADIYDGVPQMTMFYVVSIRKFTILYIATLGLYGFYWFYKNWACYKEKWQVTHTDRMDIWPVARAFFSIFFVHALLREIKALAHNHPIMQNWRNGRQATQIVLLLILANVLDRLSYRSLGSPYIDILSLVILAPLLSQFLIVQEKINVSCNDPQGKSNSVLTKYNFAWIVVGIIFWILTLIGMLISGE